jgi:hypothetical protein
VQFALAWQSVPQLHAVPGLAFSTTSTVSKPSGQDAAVEEANATSDQFAGSVQLPQLVSACVVSTTVESNTVTAVSAAEESVTVESIVTESTTDESTMVESRTEESSLDASTSCEGASSTDESPVVVEESPVTTEDSLELSAESVAPVAASAPGAIVDPSWVARPSTPSGPV